MKLIQNNALAERLRFKQTAKVGVSSSFFYEKILIVSNAWVRAMKNDSGGRRGIEPLSQGWNRELQGTRWELGNRPIEASPQVSRRQP